MKVGIGYCDHPDTLECGKQAVTQALQQAGRSDPCDLVLLFSTARHDQSALREVIASVLGEAVPIYGGGTVGVITNEQFGYAGDQIGIACIWLEGVHCDVLIESGLNKGEESVGVRLGCRLDAMNVTPETPILLFYDAVDRTDGFRLLMATPLLTGIEKGLGRHPELFPMLRLNLSGIGMIGDHSCSSMSQWNGEGIGKFQAVALVFSGDIRMDCDIFHGCHPATPYYTVTRAVGPVILEINGEPAIPFIDRLLGSAIAPEQYPFFLTFGVNHGERWGEFDAKNYANRLCLTIDRERNGIVMFEPDMVEGTEFRLMVRSKSLDYIKPTIDQTFANLGDREPVFAFFADCAGRAAGYGGADMEDATVVQQAIAGRTPVLGLYNGVEIAPIGGRPRSLDWTGVFCLFSQSGFGEPLRKSAQTCRVETENAESYAAASDAATQRVWESSLLPPSRPPQAAALEAMMKLNEQNAANILALDSVAISVRFELEQKRRSFALLSELATSLLKNIDDENIYFTVAKRINAALNMQRTVVLKKNADGLFSAVVLQGYSPSEKAAFAGRVIRIPDELLHSDGAALVTGADPPEHFGELRQMLGLPFFTLAPIILQGEVSSVLITGRLVEAPPYLVRLSRGDKETIQSICALLASVIVSQHLLASEERNRIMMDTMPLGCIFWDENGNLCGCNQETLALFGLPDTEDFFARFWSLSPETQPDGRPSANAIKETVRQAFVFGNTRCGWTFRDAAGEPFPAEVTLIRIPKGGTYTLVGYVRDMRDRNAAQQYAIRYATTKNEIMASISHEIRTPLNAILSMARVAAEAPGLPDNHQILVDQGVRSIKLLTSAIDMILDFSKLDSGQLALEMDDFSVRTMIADMRRILSKDAEEKSLYLRTHVAQNVPEYLLGDALRLQQILFNLVANAIKFTEKGGVEVNVLCQPMPQTEKVSLVFEVRDSGIGIATSHQAQIFRPLFSSDASYSRKHTGMGMGLAISHGLATLMGGNITCESRVNEGSVFRVELTLSVSKQGDSALSSEQGRHEEMRQREAHYREKLHGMKVLVAEDNKINQMIMKELLTSVGIEATIAENGLIVLQRLRETMFDLILMDIQMPEMDGLTAAAQIRSDPTFDKIPIFAVTTNAGPEHEQESREAGMNGHLTKPVDVDALYEMLADQRLG